MKKYFLVIALGVILGLSIVAHADDGDIDNIRVIPDAIQMKLAKIKINFINKSATIIYREIDSDGNFTGRKEAEHFANIADDPDTVEDETDNQYNKMVKAIVNKVVEEVDLGSTQKKALKKGVKDAYQNK